MQWRDLTLDIGEANQALFAFVEWIREDVEWDHLWYHLQHPSLCQDREGNRGILYGPGALVNHRPAFPWWGGVNSDSEMSFQVLVRGRYVTCIEHVNGIDTSNIVEAETYVDDVDPDVNQLSQDINSTETSLLGRRCVVLSHTMLYISAQQEGLCHYMILLMSLVIMKFL